MFKKYDAYKDSGVEWIGEIPTSWFNDRLGTILEPVSKKGNVDKQLLSITREKGVILRDVEDDSENHNFIPDDLSNYKLIEKGQFGMNKMKAWQGSYGVSAYTGIVSPAYYIFRFIKPIYPEFFHWAIRSKTYISFFGSASDGVRIGQWDLSKDRMKNIPFVFPDVDSQKKIIEFIQGKAEQIDQAIAIKEQQIALLNERKQIVIQKAVTQGLNPNVAMKDSGVEWIGKTPKHWKLNKLRNLCNIVRGASPRPAGHPKFFGSSGMNWITVGEVTKDEFPYLLETQVFLTKQGAVQSRTIGENTFILTNSGATLGVPKITKTPACINDGILAFLDMNKLKIDPMFLYYYFTFQTKLLREEMNQGATQLPT